VSSSRAGPSAGVLLVGHGTRDPAGTSQFFQLAETLAGRMEQLPVAAGLLEFQRPTIDEAWQTLVAAGVNHVHVAPLLLFAAGHAKDDIPQAIGRCLSETSGMTCDQALPLSRHRAVVELAVRRVDAECGGGDVERTGLIVVGRGSRDPCAQADLRILAELIHRRSRTKAAKAAFYAMAEPRLGDVVSQIASANRFRRIVVYPHLLFEGQIYREVQRQCAEFAGQFPQIEMRCCRYLGPEKEIAEAIASRVNTLASGGRVP